MKTPDSLDSIVSRALQQIKYNYYDKNKTLFEMHFGDVKVGHLDSDGKLLLIAKDQYVDFINARLLQPILVYLRAEKLDVHQVVFVSASEYARATSPDILTPLPEYTEDISGAIPDKMSPLPKTVSSVIVTNSELQEPAHEDETLSVEISYSGEYDQIVQPERIIAIPCYFLRHISRMGVENAWLYIGFRQAAYQVGLHHGVKKVDIPSRQIARWAGIHQVTFWRRISKTDTWDALNGFVVKGKSGDWVQNNADGRPHRLPNRYTISMTIPLTPQDVCTLRNYLINLAEDCGIEKAVNCALAVPPEELLLPAGDDSEDCNPMTVYELVISLGGSSKAASALQTHIIKYTDVIILTQYFAETWLPRLKPGAAWMIVWMRDSSNRDGRVSARLQDVIDLTGVTQKTVREWLLDDVVKLFVFEDPARKTRGTDSQRTFLVRLAEPVENELGANATIRSDKRGIQLGAVVNKELGVNATISNTDENDRLGAIATIRDADSIPDWVQLQYVLGANATVKSINNKESIIKLIKVKSTSYLNLINSINKRGPKEKIDAHLIPVESQEGQRQQGAVDDTNIQSIRAPGDVPEMQTNQGEVEDAEIEPADPQALFQRILKQAEVAPKIQHRFQGKPFYPFLCWLIYGASRGKIEDPVGLAISRYDQGLPESQNIKDLARDLDGLLDDLDYFKNFWSLPPLLAQVFESNTSRVRLLAKILAG